MKKTYVKPAAKRIDCRDDEQVVARSTLCNNYSLVSKEKTVNDLTT